MTDSEKLDYLITLIDREVIGMKGEFAEIKGEIITLKEDVSSLKEDVSGLKEDVSSLKEDVSNLKERMDKQEEEIRQVRIYQENVLNRNIQIIAEGHIDLVRKLDECIKVSQDDEMLRVRMNILECDMARVKEKLAMA